MEGPSIAEGVRSVYSRGWGGEECVQQGCRGSGVCSVCVCVCVCVCKAGGGGHQSGKRTGRPGVPSCPLNPWLPGSPCKTQVTTDEHLGGERSASPLLPGHLSLPLGQNHQCLPVARQQGRVNTVTSTLPKVNLQEYHHFQVARLAPSVLPHPKIKERSVGV